MGGVSGALTRHRRGIGPALQGLVVRPPLELPRLVISGVTKDSTGAALGNCTVHLHRSSDGVRVQTKTSDGSGNFTFDPVNNGNGPYQANAVDAAGTVVGITANTLYGA